MESLGRKLGLTKNQLRFVQLYLADDTRNATRAYLAVYSTKSESTAASAASALINHGKVKDYIDYIDAETDKIIIEKLTIDKDRILQEEACIAFLDIAELFNKEGYLLPIHEIPEHARRAVAGLEVMKSGALKTAEDQDGEKLHWSDVIHKLKLSDKGRALDRLEKVFGMQKDVHEIGVDGLKELLAEIDGKTRGLLPSQRDED